MVKTADQIAAFINLNRFRFTEKGEIKISLTINNEIYEELTPVHEGAMRVRMGAEMTKRLIQALQEGNEVGILIDGFEETLNPNQFSLFFSQFLGEGYVLKDAK